MWRAERCAKAPNHGCIERVGAWFEVVGSEEFFVDFVVGNKKIVFRKSLVDGSDPVVLSISIFGSCTYTHL